METIINHTEYAAFIARVFLGLLFFFQGYDAVVHIKVKRVIEAYQYSFENKGIPRFLTICGSWFTSYVELFGGALLLLGLLQPYVLYLLGLDLILVTIAFGIVKPMWDMRYVFPRLALLIFLLAMPQKNGIWSIDHLIQLFNNKL